LSSLSDAKSKSSPKSKITRKCTAFFGLQTLKFAHSIPRRPDFVKDAEA
jgi:hypothetical protein